MCGSSKPCGSRSSKKIFIKYHPSFFRALIKFANYGYNFSFLLSIFTFFASYFYIYKARYLIIFEEFTKEELRILTRGFLRRPLYLSHLIQSGCKYLYDAIISSQDMLVFLHKLTKEFIFWVNTTIRYCLTVQFVRLVYEDLLDFFWRIIYTDFLLYNTIVRLLKKDYLHLLVILNKTPYKTYYLALIECCYLIYHSIVTFLNDVLYLFKKSLKDFTYYSNSGLLRSDYNTFIFKLKWFPRYLLYYWRFFRIRVKSNLVLICRKLKKHIW